MKASLSVFVFCLVAGSSFATQPIWTVAAKSREVFQGGVAEIRISGDAVVAAKGFLRDREIVFFTEDGGFYTALVGVDLEEKPGPMKIVLRGWSRAGEEIEKPLTLQVKKRGFPEEKLSVDAAFDRLDEATQKRIETEQGQLNRLWQISTSRRLWQGRFLAPVPGAVTSPFGLRRIINGWPRSPHGGVDLKASMGTEIVASNHGQVVLREELFFSGKSIILDHGGGLYTMYFHLQDFHVAKDSQARKGDLIGRAGMSGRTTGPHLHWGARLNGARVDPFELVETK